MAKNIHEFRDPIHGFIKCSTKEREVIDSAPFQRLRHIHHLATSFLVYPGATHRRFEHSLGVMELATNIYDILTNEDNRNVIDEKTRRSILQIEDKNDREHWRQVLRMAALCHDIGHIPFSHGAESLLPEGVNHETMTWRLVMSEEMRPLWDQLHILPVEVAKIAVGQEEAKEIEPDIHFNVWESIVAEIVVGEVFGADRMDYLLRDSLHTGVAYGNFDHRRLIDTLRILPKAAEGKGESERSGEPSIGVEIGGLQAAESLIMARYLMFSQVYCHPVRRIYDIHLQEFMEAQYPKGLPTDLKQFINITDNEILSKMRSAIVNPEQPGKSAAERFMKRKHFRLVYRQTADHKKLFKEPLKTMFEALVERFGLENVRKDDYGKRTRLLGNFPVWVNGESSSARSESLLFRTFPPVTTGFVFVAPSIHVKVTDWVRDNPKKTFKSKQTGEES